MLRLAVPLIVALSFVAVADTAHAVRPPTAAEADALERDLGLTGCDWIAGISTVDETWARVEADPDECGAVGSENTAAHVTSGRWSSIAWSLDVGDLCPDDIPMPAEVAGDLGLCVAYVPRPTELLPCDDPGDTVLYLERPRGCRIEAPSQSYGAVVNLRRMRWENWGSATAIARGREAGRSVRVRAWRLRRICGDIDGSRAYTRLRITSAAGVVTAHRPAC